MIDATIDDVLSGRARWCVVHGENAEILPALPAKSIDHCLTDPPYSEHVHGKSRAGSRKVPLLDGNGRMSRCAIDRAVDFGFAHLTTDDMERIADECARVVKRWSLAFCDVESSRLWAGAFTSAGLDYCRTCAWIKIGATPQFTGDRPGVGFEAIVVAHPKGRKKWNGGGQTRDLQAPDGDRSWESERNRRQGAPDTEAALIDDGTRRGLHESRRRDPRSVRRERDNWRGSTATRTTGDCRGARGQVRGRVPRTPHRGIARLNPPSTTRRANADVRGAR